MCPTEIIAFSDRAKVSVGIILPFPARGSETSWSDGGYGGSEGQRRVDVMGLVWTGGQYRMQLFLVFPHHSFPEPSPNVQPPTTGVCGCQLPADRCVHGHGGDAPGLDPVRAARPGRRGDGVVNTSPN